jgi:hypothetical protein
MNTTNANAFILLEAEVAFYRSEPDGQLNASGAPELWMGGLPEKLTLAVEYKDRVLRRPGEPYGETYIEDEEHEIELENLWLESASRTGVYSMPEIETNAPLVMVVRWFDRETSAWAKRTYFGAKVRSQRLIGEVESGRSKNDGMQNLRLRASRMVEECGLDNAPDLLPSTGTGNFTVVYVDPNGQAVQAGALDEHGLLGLSQSGQVAFGYEGDRLSITIGGNVAMVADAGGVIVGRLVATGGTFVSGAVGHVEFRVNGSRVATLAQDGTLAVPDLFETDTAPDITGFKALNANGSEPDGRSWLFTMSAIGMYAPDLKEGL